MIDHANELRRYSRKIGHPAGDVPSVMLAAADEIERLRASLEAAEKDVTLKERVIDALGSELNAVANERDALRTALEKIADWDSAWGPYPETNEAWRAMAIVTAREAVPRRGE